MHETALRQIIASLSRLYICKFSLLRLFFLLQLLLCSNKNKTSPPSLTISVKGSYIVKPIKETPKCVMYVSDFDHTQPMTHLPIVYFYRRPCPDSPLKQPPLQTLQHSLAKVLSIFYPLAGRLQWTTNDPSRQRVEINCNSAGALLFEAESDSLIDDFAKDFFCPTQAVEDLLPPPVDYESVPLDQQQLLLVQLTRFGCGGLSLGIRISHTLIDGTAVGHFMSEWAMIARGKEPQNSPFLDRTVLKLPEDSPPPSFDHSDFGKTPLLIGHDDDSYARSRETTPGMFRLSKEQVGILKSKANKNNVNGHAGFTRYEAVSAHMWRCACKARGHQKEQQTVLRVSVNFRNRIVPNLPKFYFGNAVAPVAAVATCGELLAEPLSFACGKIKNAVEKVNDEYLKSCLCYLRNEEDLSRFRYRHVVGSKEGAFFGNPNLHVSSWLTLPLGGTDFGWGEDIHTGPGLLGYDGKSFMLDGRYEEGSVIVALSLQAAHMDAFKKLFYDDI